MIYRKWRLTKSRLDFEINDIRNLATIPRSTAEISEIKNNLKQSKYASLNESI